MSSFNDFQRQNISPVDLPRVTADGDPGFDLEHNNRVIEETIKKSERVQRAKKREFDEQLKERSWAAARFIQAQKSGKEPNAEKYFGKEYLDYLKGQQLVEKYKMIWSDAKKKEQGKKAYLSTIKSAGNV